MPDYSLKTWWQEKVSDNIKSLALSAALFTTISVAQIIYARQVNSIALLSDAAAMFVDVACYLAAIAAECIPADRPVTKRRFEMVVSFTSLVILLAIAIYYIYQASANLEDIMDMRHARQASVELGSNLPNQDPYGRNSQGMVTHGIPNVVAYLEGLNSQSGVPVKDGWNFNGIGALLYRGILPVNATGSSAVADLCANVGPGDSCDGDDSLEGGVVILVFGLLGLAIDVTALTYAFFKQYCTSSCCDDENEEEEEQDQYESDVEFIIAEKEEKDFNTLAALAHVAADLIRSVATVIAASYIIAKPGWPSSGADDLAGLVSSVTIAVGSIYGLYLWLLDFELIPTRWYAKTLSGNNGDGNDSDDYVDANDEDTETTSNLRGVKNDDNSNTLETPLLDNSSEII